MTSGSPITRLRRLSGDEKRLLLRAAGFLCLASAAVAFLPFRKAIRLGSIPLGTRKGSLHQQVWAVEAAARRLPWRTVCIEKGLVLQRLLRSSGVAALLHYGARNDPDSGKLEAHVWVTVDGVPVIGGEQASDFAAIAAYP
jgi:hypothetical protein